MAHAKLPKREELKMAAHLKVDPLVDQESETMSTFVEEKRGEPKQIGIMRSPGKRPDKNHLPQLSAITTLDAGAYVLISIKVKKQHKGFIILMLSSSYMYDPFLTLDWHPVTFLNWSIVPSSQILTSSIGLSMTSLLRAFTLALKHDFKQKQEKIIRGLVDFSPFVPDSLELTFKRKGNDRSKLGNKICTTSRWRFA